MPLFPVGSVVTDSRTNERATVRHVARIPEQRDLFGGVLPAHDRYVLEYDDGTYANDRAEGDLAPIETPALDAQPSDGGRDELIPPGL